MGWMDEAFEKNLVLARQLPSRISVFKDFILVCWAGVITRCVAPMRAHVPSHLYIVCEQLV